jgi:hypothetical protein
MKENTLEEIKKVVLEKKEKLEKFNIKPKFIVLGENVWDKMGCVSLIPTTLIQMFNLKIIIDFGDKERIGVGF